jgi:hypothetical protein
VGVQLHAPAAFSGERAPEPTGQKAEWATGPVSQEHASPATFLLKLVRKDKLMEASSYLGRSARGRHTRPVGSLTGRARGRSLYYVTANMAEMRTADPPSKDSPLSGPKRGQVVCTQETPRSNLGPETEVLRDLCRAFWVNVGSYSLKFGHDRVPSPFIIH